MGWLFTSRKEKNIQGANEFVAGLEQRGGLQPVTTDLALKKNEKAYLHESVALKETRMVSKRTSSGAGFRVMKGVYIGSSKGQSRSEPEMRHIDTGNLILTNQRLVFDGATENRVLNLDKILSVQAYRDAIEVSVENRAKSVFFTVSNPYIWGTVFKILRAVPDPENLKDAKLNTRFE